MWLLSYWVLPIISAAMWLGMLLGMLISWLLLPNRQLPSMDGGQTNAYISDVGAFSLKPLFITGAVITTVFLDLSFFAERWLRHTGRLVPNTSLTQKVLSIASMIFGIAGSAGLILLTIFDTYRYPNMHNGFLLLFIAGFIFSAILVCAEYQRLGIHYRQHRILRVSFWVKLTFILVEIAMAVAFGVQTFRENYNTGAILEWAIAFIFTGYVISFLFDLLPSVRTKNHVPQGLEEQQPQPQQQVPMRRYGRGQAANGDRGVSIHGAGPGEYEQDLTRDSSGPVPNPPYRANGYQNGVNEYKNGNANGKKAGWANRWRNF